jgi:hypothetical protein
VTLHPLPPADFDRRPAVFQDIRSGTILRIHREDRSPNFFGRTGANRFDAPDGSYGVLYGARTLAGCVAETLIRGRFQNTTWPQPITERELTTSRVARMSLARSLHAIMFLGPSLLQLGGDSRLFSEVPYATPQAWSRAAHQHPSAPDGILYPARHDGTCICVAVFERARPAIPSFTDEGPLLYHPDFSRVVAQYELTLV